MESVLGDVIMPKYISQANTMLVKDEPNYAITVDGLSKASAVCNFIDLTGDISDSEGDVDSETVIGFVLGNGRFRCQDRCCRHKTFRRLAELRRHYESTHAKKLAFWCGVPSCDRSRGLGQRPFHRKDKLNNHVRAMHGSEVWMRSGTSSAS
jgi:hypothetical protein